MQVSPKHICEHLFTKMYIWQLLWCLLLKKQAGTVSFVKQVRVDKNNQFGVMGHPGKCLLEPGLTFHD